jgi:hypothetical protein
VEVGATSPWFSHFTIRKNTSNARWKSAEDVGRTCRRGESWGRSASGSSGGHAKCGVEVDRGGRHCVEVKKVVVERM